MKRTLHGKRGYGVVLAVLAAIILVGGTAQARTSSCGPSSDKLVFTSQPASVATGASFGATVSVVTCGKVDKNANDPVTLALNAPALGSGALSPASPTATPVNGVATFSGLSINASGTAFTLAASADDAGPGTSAPFNIYDVVCVNLNSCDTSDAHGTNVHVQLPPNSNGDIGLSNNSNDFGAVQCGPLSVNASVFTIAPPPGHNAFDISVTLTIPNFFTGGVGVANIKICKNSASDPSTFTALGSCPPGKRPITQSCIVSAHSDNSGNAIITFLINSVDPSPTWG
jgi:hypothetical protein